MPYLDIRIQQYVTLKNKDLQTSEKQTNFILYKNMERIFLEKTF